MVAGAASGVALVVDAGADAGGVGVAAAGAAGVVAPGVEPSVDAAGGVPEGAAGVCALATESVVVSAGFVSEGGIAVCCAVGADGCAAGAAGDEDGSARFSGMTPVSCAADGVPVAGGVVWAPALETVAASATIAAVAAATRMRTVVSIDLAPSRRDAAPRETRTGGLDSVRQVQAQHGNFMLVSLSILKQPQSAGKPP